MVNKNNIVLDEGAIKYMPEAYMLPQYFWQFHDVVLKYRDDLDKIAQLRRELADYVPTEERYIKGQDGLMRLYPAEDRTGEIQDQIKSLEDLLDDVHPTVKLYYVRWCTEFSLWPQPFQMKKVPSDICKFMGKIPFKPCVMINISPNWKGKKITKMMIKQLSHTLDTYLRVLNRYSKWKYVLECGSTGDFLHAHCVAEINPDLLNSVLNGKNSHIRKSNHFQEIRKIWDKKGHQGLLKGKYSIQSSILRTEALRDDKLEYLLEEKKQEGHKNLKDLGLLFNVGF